MLDNCVLYGVFLTVRSGQRVRIDEEAEFLIEFLRDFNIVYVGKSSRDTLPREI